jgi:hypothetical protein
MNEYTIGSGNGASLTIGALLGEQGGKVYLLGTSRDSKRGLWKWRERASLSLSKGALLGEPAGRAVLLGTLKDT